MQNNYFKYLNITAKEERWGMYITTVGYSRIAPHDSYPNQEHPQSHSLTWNRGRILNDYYIIFISKGRGLFASSITKPTEILEGTCFFLYPGILHRYKPDVETGWEEYWVGFNGSYAENLMNNFFSDTHHPFIHTGLQKDLLIIFKELLRSTQESMPGYPQQIAGLAMQLLGMLNNISQYHTYDSDPLGKLISKARYMIEESSNDNMDMEELAAGLPMGYSSFRKSFKKITGESPHQYHLNLRLGRAKDLLANTLLNINEIADQTGFESVFYFSKLFKKKNGISPRAFRDKSKA